LKFGKVLRKPAAFIVVAIAGTSGFEGIFFDDEAAKLKGYEVGAITNANLPLHYYFCSECGCE